MAMRWYDTTKYDGGWYARLLPRFKCAWDIMCAKCTGVGVYRYDIDSLCEKVREPITVGEFQDTFGGRIFWLSASKLWIPSSFPFRNKNPSPHNRSQRAQMEQYVDLCDQFPIDEETREIRDKYVELLKTPLKRKSIAIVENLDPEEVQGFLVQYPNPDGLNEAFRNLMEHFAAGRDFDDFKGATKKYLEHVRVSKSYHKSILKFVGPADDPKWIEWIPVVKIAPKSQQQQAEANA